MPRYGIASALHGRDALQWTTSVVIANQQDDIVLGEVWREAVDPAAPSSVRAVIDRYVRTVRSTLLLRESGPEMPVVYCTQEGPMVAAIENALGTSRVSDHVERALRSGIEDPSSIAFHPRGYQHQAFGCDVPVRKRGVTVEERQRAKRNARLRSLYWKADRQADAPARSELERYIDVLAERYAERYRASGWDASTRFFLLGSHVPEHTGDVQYNMIRWFDFRRRFAEKMISLLGIDHSICVKAPLDPPSPPTADITATYLADEWQASGLAMVRGQSPFDEGQMKCT